VKEQTKIFNALTMFPSALLGIKMLLTTSAKHGGFQQWMEDMNLPSLVSILVCMTILCTSGLIAMSVLRSRGVDISTRLRHWGRGLVLELRKMEVPLEVVVWFALSSMYVHAMELYGRRTFWPAMTLVNSVLPSLLEFIAAAARSSHLTFKEARDSVLEKPFLIRQLAALSFGLCASLRGFYVSVVTVICVELWIRANTLSKGDVALRMVILVVISTVQWWWAEESPIRWGVLIDLLIAVFVLVLIGIFTFMAASYGAETGASLCRCAEGEVVERTGRNARGVYMRSVYLCEGVAAFATWVCALALVVAL
jgi:hypothetical protein